MSKSPCTHMSNKGDHSCAVNGKRNACVGDERGQARARCREEDREYT